MAVPSSSSSSSSSFSSSSLAPLLVFLLALSLTVDARPPPRRDAAKVLEGLFGAQLSSLILAQPEVTEGSADSPSPSSSSQAARGLTAPRQGAWPVGRGGAGRGAVVPRFFLDFLQSQRKFRGRSRKSAARGCFGMKVDRIGTVSGLGC